MADAKRLDTQRIRSPAAAGEDAKYHGDGRRPRQWRRAGREYHDVRYRPWIYSTQTGSKRSIYEASRPQERHRQAQSGKWCDWVLTGIRRHWSLIFQEDVRMNRNFVKSLKVSDLVICAVEYDTLSPRVCQ